MDFKFDTYTLHARLAPPLIVALPFALSAIAYAPSLTASFHPLWVVFVACGGAFLLAEVGRDRGVAKQAALFESWGGKPTVRLLRHRDATNKAILALLHTNLRTLIPTVSLPTLEQELADPVGADEIYELCGHYLRNQTRDRRRFPLVHKENTSYGFRRNLWALRSMGISTTGTSVLVPAILAALTWKELLRRTDLPILLATALANFILLLAWIFWLRPDWVKLPAVAYAERLLETCDSLLAVGSQTMKPH